MLALVIGLWGLFMFFRHRGPSSGFNSALLVTEGLFIVQGLVGVTLFASGERPHDALHWLYGILLVIVIPIAMTYGGPGIERNERRQSLIYGIAGLFMAGLAIRAFSTS